MQNCYLLKIAKSSVYYLCIISGRGVYRFCLSICAMFNLLLSTEDSIIKVCIPITK